MRTSCAQAAGLRALQHSPLAEHDLIDLLGPASVCLSFFFPLRALPALVGAGLLPLSAGEAAGGAGSAAAGGGRPGRGAAAAGGAASVQVGVASGGGGGRDQCWFGTGGGNGVLWGRRAGWGGAFGSGQAEGQYVAIAEQAGAQAVACGALLHLAQQRASLLNCRGLQQPQPGCVQHGADPPMYLPSLIAGAYPSPRCSGRLGAPKEAIRQYSQLFQQHGVEGMEVRRAG